MTCYEILRKSYVYLLFITTLQKNKRILIIRYWRSACIANPRQIYRSQNTALFSSEWIHVKWLLSVHFTERYCLSVHSVGAYRVLGALLTQISVSLLQCLLTPAKHWFCLSPLMWFASFAIEYDCCVGFLFVLFVAWFHSLVKCHWHIIMSSSDNH